jgi:hypothetical protein
MLLDFLFENSTNFEKIAKDFENKKYMIKSQIEYQENIIKYRNEHKGEYPYENYNDTQDIGALIGLKLAQKYLNM